jgi:hypothetical protein
MRIPLRRKSVVRICTTKVSQIYEALKLPDLGHRHERFQLGHIVDTGLADANSG